MRAGWEQVGGQQWYRRDVEAGPLSFSIDLWSVDADDNEWASSVNNGRRELLRGSVDKAMAAAEISLADHLRVAARLCRTRQS